MTGSDAVELSLRAAPEIATQARAAVRTPTPIRFILPSEGSVARSPDDKPSRGYRRPTQPQLLSLRHRRAPEKLRVDCHDYRAGGHQHRADRGRQDNPLGGEDSGRERNRYDVVPCRPSGPTVHRFPIEASFAPRFKRTYYEEPSLGSGPEPPF